MKIVAGLVSLSLVLLYNFVHTGNVLAAFVDPQWVGYAAAFGIESIVIFLSAQISERRNVGRDTDLFVGALVAVVVVSAFANIAQGYLVKFGKPLEMVVFGATDFAQLVVWISSTGLLSLVTFAMAEIIGDDITASSQDKAQPVAKPASKRKSRLAAWFDRLRYRDGIKQWDSESAAFIDKISASLPQPLAQGPQVPQTDEIGTLGDDAGQDVPLESSQTPLGGVSMAVIVENTLPAVSQNEAAQIATLERGPVTTAEIILEYYQRNPDATMTQAAQHVARATGTPYSRQAVAAQLQRLEVAGRIARNGHVEVLT